MLHISGCVYSLLETNTLAWLLTIDTVSATYERILTMSVTGNDYWLPCLPTAQGMVEASPQQSAKHKI